MPSSAALCDLHSFPTRRSSDLQYLIDLVDEAGYLPADLGQAADRLGAEQADVDAVLGVLQTFDPPGICARNLSECLADRTSAARRSEEHTSELQSHSDLVCRLLLLSVISTPSLHDALPIFNISSISSTRPAICRPISARLPIGSAPNRPMSMPCWACCRRSIRPASARAI